MHPCLLRAPPGRVHRAAKVASSAVAFLRASGADEDEKKQALQAQLTQLDSHVASKGPFLSGSQISSADLSLAPKVPSHSRPAWLVSMCAQH